MSSEYGDHIDFRGGTFHGPVVGAQYTYVAGPGSFSTFAPVPVDLSAVPARPIGFTGRQAELDRLLNWLEPSSRTSPPVMVVHGMGGTGKTALVTEAVHAAPSRGLFPGGVLYLCLHGYEPAPINPDLALSSLLHALGLAPEHIPVSPEDRAALYRSELSRREQAQGPVLVVLDDVSSASQARALLPPAGACRTLITSRHRFPQLYGAILPLDVLSSADSFELLDRAVRIADPHDDRITRGPGAAEALVELCGGLPLALQIAAALLVEDPALPTTALVEELALTRDRTAALDDGERSVRAAFDLSYRMLPEPEARLFELLALAPGPEFGTDTADALFGRSARRALLGLVRAGLVGQTGDRRWRLHDLVREYALSAVRHRPAAERTAAERRLMEYYAQTAEAADRMLTTSDSDGGPFADAEQALAWLDGERVSLVAAVLSVAEGRLDALRVLDLAVVLCPYLHGRGHIEDLASVATTALRIACPQRDERRMAFAYRSLGLAELEQGDFEEAAATQMRALERFGEVGDIRGEAALLVELSITLTELSRLDEALVTATRAVEHFESLADTPGQAAAWSALGRVTRAAGRAEASRDAFSRAVDLLRLVGDRRGESTAQYELGVALAKFGEHREAADAYASALSIAVDLGDLRSTADALHALAVLHEGQHHAELARDYYERAAAAYLDAGATAEATNAQERSASL